MFISNSLMIHLLPLTVTIVVVLIWLLIAITQFRLVVKSNDSKHDIRRAIIIGLTSGGIYVVILFDVGFYMWLETGDLLGPTVALILLCLMPFVQLITVIGTLLQISYSRKMSHYISFVGQQSPTGKDDFHPTK